MSNNRLNEVASSQAPGLGHCYDPNQVKYKSTESPQKKKSGLFPMTKKFLMNHWLKK
tara:strand:+ start:117 stop:287 length:171 start_codon:yes stop_codon:yes gene_type:complete